MKAIRQKRSSRVRRHAHTRFAKHRNRYICRLSRCALYVDRCGIFLVPDGEKTLATSNYVVVHYIHTIKTADGHDCLFFIVTRAFLAFSSQFCKFASEDGRKKITIATGRLQET